MTKNLFTAHHRASSASYGDAVTVADPRNAPLGGLSVLIVEDDAAIGSQLARGLGRVGCHADVVRDGAGALQHPAAGLVLLGFGPARYGRGRAV